MNVIGLNMPKKNMCFEIKKQIQCYLCKTAVSAAGAKIYKSDEPYWLAQKHVFRLIKMLYYNGKTLVSAAGAKFFSSLLKIAAGGV